MLNRVFETKYMCNVFCVAPGGTVVEDADTSKVCRAEACVFTAEEDFEALKAYYEVSPHLPSHSVFH